MFTIEQIRAAHAKVKSGADFPKYIKDLIDLGLKNYRHQVKNGCTIYLSTNGTVLESDAKYPELAIAADGDKEQLKHHLKIHQQGQTEYFTFCSSAAVNGVEQWIVDTNEMTCTYYDKAGNKMLAEAIPAVA